MLPLQHFWLHKIRKKIRLFCLFRSNSSVHCQQYTVLYSLSRVLTGSSDRKLKQSVANLGTERTTQNNRRGEKHTL